jgi:hypothetical protein
MIGGTAAAGALIRQRWAHKDKQYLLLNFAANVAQLPDKLIDFIIWRAPRDSNPWRLPSEGQIGIKCA